LELGFIALDLQQGPQPHPPVEIGKSKGEFTGAATFLRALHKNHGAVHKERPAQFFILPRLIVLLAALRKSIRPLLERETTLKKRCTGLRHKVERGRSIEIEA
jgi:hypothetical protein